MSGRGDSVKPTWGYLLLLTLMLACSCHKKTHTLHPQLLHDAYIWQRRWTPALATAVQHSAALVRMWRVLAAQSDKHGRLHPVDVKWTMLEQSKRPVILVVRIEGQLAHWDEEALFNDLSAVLGQWEHYSAPVAGIEIDYDCGTARLPAYARFLTALRTRLGREMPLSVTALPAWLSSQDLDAVLAQTDEVVLQVHAVQSPTVGLFDPKLALQWIETLAQRSNLPFRVALPAYGSRVSWRKDGGLLAVESETPLFTGGDGAVEWMASPKEVALLLRELERTSPPHLVGVVWFRLPTIDDTRAWSPNTWRAVIQGTPFQDGIEVRIQPSETADLNNLMLINPGEVDAELPQTVSLPSACTLADGINGYTLEHANSGLILQRLQGGLLRSRHQQVIGWMRCTPELGAIHVRP